MVERVTRPKAPGFPPSGEEPKISSTLAHNVGQTTKVVKGLYLILESADLAGLVTPGPADETAAGELAADNMLRWRGY